MGKEMFKRSRKKTFIIILSVIIFLILLVILSVYLYNIYALGQKKTKGMEIITMIETYKAEHDGLYPESLEQFGTKERESDGASIYKGDEFYYRCSSGCEFFLEFYFSDNYYNYSSLVGSWVLGDGTKERNEQAHKLFNKIMSPENQNNISEKYFYDSVFYSIADSQEVANIRMYYKNGNLAARGKVLLNPNRTRVGDWILYSDDGVGLEVYYNTKHPHGSVVEYLSPYIDGICGIDSL
jgi:hypothetical protein